MSSIEAVTIPKWGMTMTEGTVVQWLVKEGEKVTRGQELLEVESTKVNNVVESTADGVLKRIVIQEGDAAPVGALIGVIADDSASDEEIEALIESYAHRMNAVEDGDAAGNGPRAVAVPSGVVNVLDVGAEGDEAVVLIHGFGGDLSTWMFNQAVFAEKLRTIAVDLPGHGASTPVATEDVFAAITDALIAATDATGVKRLHLVGHSFGGAVAAAIAEKEPDKVASLTLIAPVGLSKEINRAFLADFVAAERRRPLLNVLERLFSDPSKITSEMVEGTLQFKRLEGVQEALSRIAESIANDDGQARSIGAALEKLQCPVMAIWGERDAIIPVPEQSKLPSNVELRVIPEVGHMPQMEASSALNDAVFENIRRAR
ncbi:acetoin dehydrogenase dihydrolipoyllysine-residue acetyltransferase subunit [Paraburkholderia dipogonis]|uniref:Acetoin dehydrogenase dihydrolipoyllysine-residue acetyltransferase subunit n=1 Tax=Paraburkholderia dipogonis TaxID=1211383 RepID=A0A4Y8MIX8_9BURK|nr:acetoin dehydrogenase dihydrolipoyllysine-residue acetyltransferase subunit [Paraburkholderia dipogonis]TFE37391.1 acetoin dehydrogenase dihydrolipoyllysine-residue acetyltransferase subunit [Paraburkholderia dipogonis]